MIIKVVNNREFGIIGTTAGTHFFDVTDPANSTQVAFVEGGYTGGGVIHRDYHDFAGYLYMVFIYLHFDSNIIYLLRKIRKKSS